MTSEMAAKKKLDPLSNPEEYWSYVAKHGVWTKPWTQTLDSSNKPIYKWFIGGETNLCYNLLDKPVEDGKGDAIALICESAATKTSRKVTYSELLQEVKRFAGALRNYNVVNGDMVFMYMANTLELIVAILATWRIGGTALILLPNTTASALADRIQLSKPKIFITGNATKINNSVVYFKKPLDEALRSLDYQAKVIVYQRKEFDAAELNPKFDVLWEDAIRNVGCCQWAPTDSNTAALVMCSSGTTGKPKGIVYTTGGYLTSLCYRLVPETAPYFKDDSILFVPSHPGWVSGIFGTIFPLIGGACGIVYDGDASGNGDIDTIYRIISDNRATSVMFNAAVLRELRLADPDGVHARKYDLSSVSSIRSGAEVLDKLSFEWAKKHFGVTLVEAWGQTEGPNASELLSLLENEDLSFEEQHAKFPGLGCSFKIFDEEGNEQPVGKTGFIATKLPNPPHCIATLHLNDEQFIKEYFSFQGYFNTKDLGWMDKNGNLHIVGRGDDLMKVSGVSMTTTEAEDAILRTGDIARCAVVPLKHREMYQVPVAFYTLKEGKEDVDTILDSMKENMKDCFGPAVIFNYALRVKTIPTSNTGKISRKIIQTELQNVINEVSHNDNPEKVFEMLAVTAKNLGML